MPTALDEQLLDPRPPATRFVVQALPLFGGALARYAIKVWRAEDHPRDPLTGRFIPKPGGPARRRAGGSGGSTGGGTARGGARRTGGSTAGKTPPEPKESAGKKLTVAAQRRVDKARKALPNGTEQWRAPVVASQKPGRRRIDAEVERLEKAVAAAQERADRLPDELLQEFRRARTPKDRRAGIIAARNAQAQADVDRAKEQLRIAQGLAADPELLKEQKLGAFLAEMLPGEAITKYPTDRNGVRVAPPEYDKALDAVLDAGKAIHADLEKKFTRDKDLKDLKARQASETSYFGQEEIRRQIARREQQITMEVLGQVRGFGGAKYKTVNAADSMTLKVLFSDGRPARADWKTRLATGMEFFPDDWIRAGRDVPLTLLSSERAFYYGRRGSPQTYLAMSDGSDVDPYYTGGFASYVDEVTVHELGHRMEATVPGLQELEFAFVRRQSTRGGVVEPVSRMSDLTGNRGYGPREVALPDNWRNPYAGKTYEKLGPAGDPADSDPGAQPWEVFQVGLQDTLGRTSRFGGDELKHFTLGVLATLAHPEGKK